MSKRIGVVLLILLMTTWRGAEAGPPPPLPTPNVQLFANGTVNALAILPDGSTVVGGLFTSVYDPSIGLSIDRQNLAKFTPDRRLDLQWNPGADGEVLSLVSDGAAAVYVAGRFSTISNVTRSRVAKVSASGSGEVDPTWNPDLAAAVVHALVLGPDNSLFIAGGFDSVGSIPQARLAKVSRSGTGGAIAEWNPALNGSPNALAIDDSGFLYVGGNGAVNGGFSTVDGVPRFNIAKISVFGSGELDGQWHPYPTSGGGINALHADGFGNLYIGGDFSHLLGIERRSLARVGTGGTGAVDNWNPAPDGNVLAIAPRIGASGSVFVAGNFNTIGGQPRKAFAALDNTGAVLAAWDLGLDCDEDYGCGLSLAPAPSGGVIVGGRFASSGNLLALGLAAASAAGTRLDLPSVQTRAVVNVLLRASDGGFFVGGQFARADSLSRRNLLRLLPSGLIDASWNPAPDGAVSAIAEHPQGALYIGGSFRNVGGASKRGLAKLNATGPGGVDSQWNAGVNGTVNALAISTDGAVLAGGDLTVQPGQETRNLVKMAASGAGAVDAQWDHNFNGTVFALLVHGSGDIYAGGAFSTVDGMSRGGMARFASDASGTLDPIWAPATGDIVRALAFRGEELIAAGGTFAFFFYSGYLRKHALSGVGAADPVWNPDPRFPVYAIAVDAEGSVFAGGDFGSIGGASRFRIAKLSGQGTGAADPGFDPGVNTGSRVVALAVVEGGNVLVGGDFATIGGVGRAALARLPGRSNDVFRNGFE